LKTVGDFWWHFSRLYQLNYLRIEAAWNLVQVYPLDVVVCWSGLSNELTGQKQLTGGRVWRTIISEEGRQERQQRTRRRMLWTCLLSCSHHLCRSRPQCCTLHGQWCSNPLVDLLAFGSQGRYLLPCHRFWSHGCHHEQFVWFFYRTLHRDLRNPLKTPLS